jgi:hypothetical protein
MFTLKNYILIGFTFVLSSCSLLGDKKNNTANEVFNQGSIDPNTGLNNVGYVPVYPFINNVNKPLDVFYGYDELIYVVVENDETTIDDNEVLVFDQKADLSYRFTIPGATDFTQDRRLHSYVAGRYYPDKVGSPSINLAAIYHITGIGSGNPVYLDTLKHFQCDESRRNTSFRGNDDIAVKFTGLATLFDNTLYVSRTGPRNDLSAVARPDNGVLIFSAQGENIGYSTGLNPLESSIKSSVGISGLATLAAPPQRISGISTSRNFFLALGEEQNRNLEFRALGISVTEDPDQGYIYGENTNFLNFDKTKADRFMYESGRFKKPEDIFASPTENGFLFITDSGTDSIYVFSNTGFEGVNPPANSTFKKQVIVSFGGSGADGKASGPYNFVDPTGICYFNRTIFVCDKGNNRVCRYRLNSDLQ